jgi:hypothetical protein
MLKCGKCQVISYCDKQCQKQDWKFGGHAVECGTKLLQDFSKKEVAVKQNPWTFHILRTLSKLKNQPDLATKEHYMYNGTTKNFQNLLENVDKSIELGDIGDDCKNLLGKLKEDKLLPSSIENEKEEVKKLLYVQGLIELWSRFGIEIKNSISDEKVVAHSIFIEGSFFDHSCQPTAVRIISNNKLQVCKHIIL